MTNNSSGGNLRRPGRKLQVFLLRRSPWPILAFTLLLFIGTLGYEPIAALDDGHYVFINPNLGFSPEQLLGLLRDPVAGLWTPLPQLTYLVDYAIAGYSPWVYHLGNILWHLAGIACLWQLLRALGLRWGTAFWVALIYAIHPQRVESVVWIAERKDVVSAFFFFATLTGFIRLRNRGKWFGAGTFTLFTLSLFCKPTLAALPAVMFLLEVYRARRWDFRGLLRLWPCWLASALFYLFSSHLVTGSVERIANLPVTLAMMLRNYLLFAGKALLPLDLSPLYPCYSGPGELLLPGAVAAAALAGILFYAWRRPAWFRCELLPFLLIFGGMLLPFSGIVPFSNADFADRYSLLAGVFLTIPAALLIERQRAIRGGMLTMLLLLYAGYLALYMLHYQTFWKNSRTLLAAACDTPRPSFLAAGAFAWLELRGGEIDRAVEVIDRAGVGKLEEFHQTRQLAVFRDLIHGLAAYMRNQPEAEKLLSAAVDSPYGRNLHNVSAEAVQQAYLALAEIALRRGDAETAGRRYRELAGHRGIGFPFYQHYYRGVAAMIERDYAAAVREFEAADRIKPGNPETEKNLQAARQRLAAEGEKKP